jgi:hypothetical protein
VVVIQVFVDLPSHASETANTAIRRAHAAVKRFGDCARVELVPIDSQRASDLGIAIEPTVAINGLVLAVGQAPSAGHLVRAIEAAVEEGP